MAKHSRRPPGEEREAEAGPSEPLPRGLRRGADGRVILDDVEPIEPLEVSDDGGALDPAQGGVIDAEVRDTVVGDTVGGVDAVVGERAGRIRHPARRVMAVARRARVSGDGAGLEEVGGPIQPTPTIYFGRPPGTENRRAGAASLIGGLLLLAAAFVPWATREPASLGATAFGWRDASGGYGPGPMMLLLALVGLVLAVGALMGSTHRGLQLGDVCVGMLAVLVAVVEWLRIRSASDSVSDLTDSRATLSPSWGIVLAVVGGLVFFVAAAVHRSTPPAWRQGDRPQ